MVEIEDIKVQKTYKDGTYIIISGTTVEGRPGLCAQLFIPPDRYEYLVTLPFLSTEVSDEELYEFINDVEKHAEKALQKSKLEMFLEKHGFKKK